MQEDFSRVYPVQSPTWPFGDESWSGVPAEGKLAVDVVETGEVFCIFAPMAGACLDEIEVYAHNDLVTIRGRRAIPPAPLSKHIIPNENNFIHSECFWGPFSRTIVLPAEVHGEQAVAEYKNGILTILIPKRSVDIKIDVKIVED